MFGGDLPYRILVKVLEEILGSFEMVSDQEVVTKTSHFSLTFVLGACFLLLALREASYHVLSQGETHVQ